MSLQISDTFTLQLWLCYLLFYLVWCPRFLISKQHFRWFLLKYLEYSHKISPQKSEKYDMKTFGIKITVSLKKIGGMMLWIMSGTFKFDLTNSAIDPPKSSFQYFTSQKDFNYFGGGVCFLYNCQIKLFKNGPILLFGHAKTIRFSLHSLYFSSPITHKSHSQVLILKNLRLVSVQIHYQVF